MPGFDGFCCLYDEYLPILEGFQARRAVISSAPCAAWGLGWAENERPGGLRDRPRVKPEVFRGRARYIPALRAFPALSDPDPRLRLGLKISRPFGPG